MSCAGGAQGIGLAFCFAIIEAGGEVAVLDIRSEPDPSALALQRDGKYHYFPSVLWNTSKFEMKACLIFLRCDISQQVSLEAAFKCALDALGGILHGWLVASLILMK